MWILPTKSMPGRCLEAVGRLFRRTHRWPATKAQVRLPHRAVPGRRGVTAEGTAAVTPRCSGGQPGRGGLPEVLSRRAGQQAARGHPVRYRIRGYLVGRAPTRGARDALDAIA